MPMPQRSLCCSCSASSSSNAKEGHAMNADFWIEILILALRIVSAGIAS